MADISSTLVSNSTQLDNIDLQGGPRVFTITGVTLSDGDQPVSIALAEYGRPWKPGLTMRRLLTEMWGAETDAWHGRRVRLYRDETVTFGRDKTGGTRISHASHIDKAIAITLPTSKGKFGEFKVQPLTDAAPAPAVEPVEVRARKAVDWFAGKGVTVANLEAHVGKSISEWAEVDVAELKANSDSIIEANA